MNHIIPIQERFLNSGDLFGLRFSEGAMFFQVESVVEHKVEPYDFGTVGPQSSTGYEIPQLGGDNILEIESKTANRILHVGVGHSPDVARRYTRYPEGQTVLRTLPNSDISVPSATNGTTYGNIDGSESPYEQPSAREELWIVPDETPEFAFYNPDTEEVNIEANIKMSEYWVNIIDPRKSDNKEAIRRILSPGSPIPFQSIGNPRAPVSYELAWDTGPVEVSKVRNAVGLE
jgi:hypothetical protein